MSARFKGLILGPIFIIAAGFLFFGEWGMVIGLFVGMAALVFIPIFGLISHVLGATSLVPLILIANLIPLGYFALGCFQNACPNFSWDAALPAQLAATFCGFVTWFFVRNQE